MAIPDFQTLMLPTLRIAGDAIEHRTGDVVSQLASEFGLTEGEREQLLPSGKGKLFANRVNWAKTYLVQAGLLEATKRAHFKITDRGKKSLAEGVLRIDNDYLSQFPEFIEFRERGRGSGEPPASGSAGTLNLPLPVQTPDELLRSTIAQIETALKKRSTGSNSRCASRIFRGPYSRTAGRHGVWRVA